jgi:hypothetical protein
MSTNDPMVAATEEREYSTEFYGKVEIAAQFMYVNRGERPRPFDDANDDIKKRSTEVSITLTTLDAMGLTRPVIERKHLSWTPAWKEIVWKSIQALGYDLLRDLSGKFVKIEMVPTGRKYTSKTDGTEKSETTLKFLKVYESEAACIRDYEDAAGVSHEASEAVDESAMTVARALISASKGDMKKLANNLKAAGSPYTVDSQVIVNLLQEVAVPA